MYWSILYLVEGTRKKSNEGSCLFNRSFDEFFKIRRANVQAPRRNPSPGYRRRDRICREFRPWSKSPTGEKIK